jgi:hypothetical protein
VRSFMYMLGASEIIPPLYSGVKCFFSKFIKIYFFVFSMNHANPTL